MLSSSQNWEEGWETGLGSSQRETRNNWHSATRTIKSSQLPRAVTRQWLAPWLCDNESSGLWIPLQHLWIISSRFYVSVSPSKRGRLSIWFGEGNGTPLQYSCLENPMDGGAWWAAIHRVVKSGTQLSDFTFTFHFSTLEKEMATHSSVLAWRIPGTTEPGGLLSTGSHRVGHDWSGLAAAAAYDWLCLDHMASYHWPVGKDGSLSIGEFPPN